MCKYCGKMIKTVIDIDEYNTWERLQSVFYPEPYDFFLLQDQTGWHIALDDDDKNTFIDRIAYCPWCGRKLELPDDEAEFSAEDEIARLEGRINHTNTLLKTLVEAVWLWVDQSEYNPSATPEVIETLVDIIGKI